MEGSIRSGDSGRSGRGFSSLIAPDANLLIYSYNPVAPQHERSRKWMQDVFSSSEPVGIPILSVHAFLRFVTHPNHLRQPASFAEAAATIDSWLALPHVRILYPGYRHWGLMKQLSEQARIRGAQITDAAIAAIAIEYGAVVHSNDRDFARFPGLRWVNPLEG
jgi:toxin-antitoxin system PIN domain toxin